MSQRQIITNQITFILQEVEEVDKTESNYNLINGIKWHLFFQTTNLTPNFKQAEEVYNITIFL